MLELVSKTVLVTAWLQFALPAIAPCDLNVSQAESLVTYVATTDDVMMLCYTKCKRNNL